MFRLIAFLGVLFVGAASLWGQVVINEVAWAGTRASGYDEWIELHNVSAEAVDLSGWRLLLGEREIPLAGVIPPRGFFLLERTDDTTVADREADLIYKGAMPNRGLVLVLLDPEGNAVDTANAGAPEGWFAGGTEARASMERVSPEIPDSPVAWRSGSPGEAHDAAGNPIAGTPGARNAAVEGFLPVSFLLPAAVLAGTVELAWEVEGNVEGVEVRLFAEVEGTWRLLAAGLPPVGTLSLDTTELPNGRIRFALGAFDDRGSRGGAVVEGEIAN